MELNSLRHAITLADELNFGRAAQREYISPGQFGRRIKTLERTLGTQLFSRTSRRVELTPTGAEAVAQARVALAALDDLYRIAKEMSVHDRPVLRIGTLGIGIAEKWPFLRRAALAAMPNLELMHADLDFLSQYDAVRLGKADIGFVHYLGEVDDLQFQPLRRFTSTVVVPARSSLADAELLTPEDVADNGWVRIPAAHPRLVD